MKRPLPVCGWIWVLSIWVLACQPETISPASTLAAPSPARELSAPTQNTPPSAPARNCQVTIVNASTSTSPYAHMAVALGTPDLAGLTQALHCPIAPGERVSICLPQGELTLYTFSNMYQFSAPIRVSIGASPVTLRLKSGH